MITGAATALTALLARPAAAAATPKPSGGKAFTNVTVIDPATSRVVENTTVTIRGDLITDVGGRIPSDVEIVDLRGKFLIPGLAANTPASTVAAGCPCHTG